MNLNIAEWKEFAVSAILKIYNGKGITKEEIEDNEGDFTVVQSGEENNGVLGKINKEYCKKMNYTLSERPCLTVARSGSAGFVSFQSDGCVVGDSAKILLLEKDVATNNRYLFLRTILTANRFKYAYGRKVTENKYMRDVVRLPIQYNNDGTPFIDNTYKYSDEGYVPDWQFMENYIKSLHYKPLTTQNRIGYTPNLGTNNWKFFYLKDICNITMGNKLDFSNMTFDDPTVNFVGRSADDNGVAGKVDFIDDIQPYPSGSITVALGGSLGSSYVQTDDFYTSQNVSVLEFEDTVTLGAKLFITTSIMNECKYKYFPFGRELNTHIRTDFGFALPIQHNGDGTPFIDNTYKYSDEGYVPDWKFMDKYIKLLSYGDRLSDVE
ncbi:restriction endonuclease subunit S [Clostridium butyricum]|uniref:Restriction enzyme, BgcI family n=1 Tax=Clostridium butyricum E4 str. BoNT E BL5262 TaxID=632245 RepID=C4IEW3_CLOBU|nr:restriction endonuclease subunit S [Clostridium butyricum]EDT74394.1 putative S-CspCI [Clostridium butyricum 5521]EEP55495.1 restriction enzyme, BgcI family [Clostridium butyricum E4 str. BoNT E BL5262]NFL29679.1 methyltransferase [Clostridium butyricum]NFS16816.1 methyltransferase [Clostridium butyricum]